MEIASIDSKLEFKISDENGNENNLNGKSNYKMNVVDEIINKK